MNTTILDHNGHPIESGRGRNGTLVDGFAIANGAVISVKESLKLHHRLKSDSEFRQRVLTAQRMAYDLRHRTWVANGKCGVEPKPEVLHHIALLDNTLSSEDKKKQDLIVKKHIAHGEKIARHRAETENLTGSKAAYEKIDNLGN